MNNEQRTTNNGPFYMNNQQPTTNGRGARAIDDAPRRELRHPVHDLRHTETVRPEQDEGGAAVAFGRYVRDRGDCGLGDCLYDYAVGVRSSFLSSYFTLQELRRHGR